MNKAVMLGLVFLFCLSFAYGADGCLYGENCTFYVYGATGVDGVNISYTYENQTETSEFEMTSLGSGKYLHSYVFNISENVMGCARTYNSSGTVGTSCESKQIGVAGQELQEADLSFSIFSNQLVIIIAALLLIGGLFIVITRKR